MFRIFDELLLLKLLKEWNVLVTKDTYSLII